MIQARGCWRIFFHCMSICGLMSSPVDVICLYLDFSVSEVLSQLGKRLPIVIHNYFFLTVYLE